MAAKQRSLPPISSPASDDEADNVAVDVQKPQSESHVVNGATNENASKSKKKKAAVEDRSGPVEYEADEGYSTRKRKRKANPIGGDVEQKRSGFAPLWSEKDEVAILTGIKLYWEEKGSDPFNDLGAFHDFVQNSLSVVVSKRQLADKARRLKKKYSNDALVSPRDLRLFEISKEIWKDGDKNASAGNSEKQAPHENVAEEAAGTTSCSGKSKQAEKSDEDVIVGKGDSDLESSYPNFYAELMDFYSGSGRVDGRTLVKDNLGLAEEKARVLEPELNAYYVWEIKMRAEKIRLLNLIADSGVELISKVVDQ